VRGHAGSGAACLTARARANVERRQTNVAFTGMQASGLYRSWPGLYQCLTENTCSGCSDVRFRGWYASAASGAKDVVIVIDISGSMQQSNRIEHAKMAASWTLNTLSETDYAMVVTFDTTADSQSTHLLQCVTLCLPERVMRFFCPCRYPLYPAPLLQHDMSVWISIRCRRTSLFRVDVDVRAG
jgi:hypothetical protein